MSEPDSEREPRARRTVPRSGAKKGKGKGKKRREPRPQLTEDQINAPDRQTVVMLGVLTALSVLLWGFAHAACNYHPPRETRRPRVVKTEELTRDPKSAAVELVQRWATRNYRGALEIAAGPLVEQIGSEQKQCAANAAECEKQKQTLSSSVITTGAVMERGASNAKVRVVAHGTPGGKQAYLVRAERSDKGWKVTARVPDAPDAELPPPVLGGAEGHTIRLKPMDAASDDGAEPHGQVEAADSAAPAVSGAAP